MSLPPNDQRANDAADRLDIAAASAQLRERVLGADAAAPPAPLPPKPAPKSVGASSPAGAARPAPPAPPECFGFQMGWMMQDGVADPAIALRCYDCHAFDRCNRISTVRALQLIRYEIRKSTQGLRESLGGSHSSQPFW